MNKMADMKAIAAQKAAKFKAEAAPAMEEAKKKATSMMNFMSGKANSMFGGSKKEKKANPQDAMYRRNLLSEEPPAPFASSANSAFLGTPSEPPGSANLNNQFVPPSRSTRPGGS